ncbi:hypothetical protein HU200_046438 [Digitaria exilis]|uniref:RING-type domain-containing protein n=1 Tax=Digitaria exilis TaxID=1010633 RepID=A0A835AYE2_9POAL|nr:hypothetical protein HU200_046438 [Digitaria exilis]
MVAAAGLPLECAPSVKCFVRKAASNATNSFYKAVGVTVEAGSPGSIVVEDDEGEGEEVEEVPPGADAGECAICYAEYLVGGATSVSLPCGHTFHRRCIDRWTSVKRSCPYCRGPVDEEQNAYWDEEEEEEEEEEEVGDYGYGSEHDGGELLPGEEEQETASGEAVSGSDWVDGLTHVVSLLGSWEI